MTLVRPANASGNVYPQPRGSYCATFFYLGGWIAHACSTSYSDACSALSSGSSYSAACGNICVTNSSCARPLFVVDQSFSTAASCPANATGTPATNPTSCTCNDPYVPELPDKTRCILEIYSIALHGLDVTVMPGATLSPPAYAEVTKGDGTPKGGAQVNLALTVVPEDDGYNHAVGQHTAPHEGSLLPIAGSTDSNGKLSFVFTAREAGGTHTITATCATCNNSPVTGRITVPGCPVHDLPPITDTEVQAFENNPNRSNTNRLSQRMGLEEWPSQGALLCLQNAIRNAGGTSTVGSAFRPPAYNQHMIDVWDKWMVELRMNMNPACRPLRSRVEAHFNRHGMVHRPAPNSRHTQGEAFDLTSSLPDATLDALAGGCQVYRNIPDDDRVHFIHR